MFVHKVLCKFRSERMPKCKSLKFSSLLSNLDYLQKIDDSMNQQPSKSPGPRQVQKPTPFRTYQEDTKEINLQCFKTDLPHMTICNSIEFKDRDRGVVDLLMKDNFVMLKDIYHHVQGRSLEYPLVTADSLYKNFWYYIDLPADYDKIQKAEFLQLLPVSNPMDIKRYQLVEFVVKLANHLKMKNDLHHSVIMR